jgi:thiol-disulfide isomerase/thioredoxin
MDGVSHGWRGVAAAGRRGVKIALALLATAWAMPLAAPQGAPAKQIGNAHPEASPFNPKANAKAEVDAALTRAAATQKYVLIVMGANWCHDSRALAGWFETPRFTSMIAARYELVYVDVGYKDRNIDIARRFGIKKIKGTPTVLIVDSEGKLLNKKDAPTWRNSASRSEGDIYRAFAEFTGIM